VVYSLARSRLRRRYGAAVDAVRREHGLLPSASAIFFDHGVAPAATLCCWSETLGGLPPDTPASAILTGFPFFDSQTGAEEAIPAELEDFLADGDPPLVFTLGSVAVEAAGKFYEQAAAAARTLGKRAVMLTGKPGDPRIEGGCLFMDYAPHSALFPRAAAVVHHGGIGTSGQALRAGRPQIVVPHFGDQFDNAARLQHVGCANTIRRGQFEAAAVAAVINVLLGNPKLSDAARAAAAIVADEDGETVAARSILSHVLTR
jgi:UDP:flavonoid glycosyltransferase YjiC (YdhE family)